MGRAAGGAGDLAGPCGRGAVGARVVVVIERGGVGRVEIVATDKGQIGVCVLPDGRRIEEWEFFRSQKNR